MTNRIVTCPECNKNLKVRGTLTEGKKITCPSCGSRFEPAPLSKSETPRGIQNQPLLYAAAALLLFGGVGLGMGLYRTTSPVVPVVPVASVETSYAPTTASFQSFMVQGNDALARGEFAGAVRAYTMAQQLSPTSVDAARGLAAARAELGSSPSGSIPAPVTPVLTTTDDGATVTADSPDPTEAARTAFRNWMNQGQAAMIDGKYDAATNCYREALKVAPDTGCRDDNQTALNGLRKAGYAKAMADADSHMRSEKYKAAVQDYETALQKKPNDSAASNGLIHARSFAMSK